MATIISTSGVGSKFTRDALMGLGGTTQDPNGRFYLDGSTVNVELSRTIAEVINIDEIFRDGMSVTAKYTTNLERNGAVRVMIDTPLPFSSRTTSYGGRKGTPGNDGVINTNPAQMPANDEFFVYLNQVNDQDLLFPELQMQYIPLDIMASKVANYAKRVAMDRSASTLAEIIGYAFFRALNDGGNLINNGDLTAENAYANLFNTVNSALDNGDQITGAYTFPTEGRTIIGRPAFINGLFSRNSGVIVLGGDMAQKMLLEYDLDAGIGDRRFVGNNYKGNAMGLHFVVAPDYLWTLAEMDLNLPTGALANVNAIAVSYEATAVATGIDLGVKMIDSQRPRGVLAQPINMWGHEAFRKSYVIGDSTLTTTYLNTTLGLTENDRLRPIAPNMVNNRENTIGIPVYDQAGNVSGYKPFATVPTPNGDNLRSGLPHVAGITASVESGAVTSGTDVTLTTTTDGATIYYTTNGDEPTTASTQYTGTGIDISAATTIKAIAVKSGSIPSDVATFTYTIA